MQGGKNGLWWPGQWDHCGQTRVGRVRLRTRGLCSWTSFHGVAIPLLEGTEGIAVSFQLLAFSSERGAKRAPYRFVGPGECLSICKLARTGFGGLGNEIVAVRREWVEIGSGHEAFALGRFIAPATGRVGPARRGLRFTKSPRRYVPLRRFDLVRAGGLGRRSARLQPLRDYHRHVATH